MTTTGGVARLSAMDVELLVIPQRMADAAEQRALARDVERGLRMRVRRGVYVDSAVWSLLEPVEQHLLSMRALDAASERRPVFSHWSAVALLGLPTFIGKDRLRPHVIVPTAGSRGAAGVAQHVLPVDVGETTELRGLRCTNLVRTVVDVAAGASFEFGVAVADQALHASPGIASALLAAVQASGERRGAARIAKVVSFADGASESPGESISRATMARIGVPAPVLQQVFRDRDGFAARTDFWFPRQRAAGEMDGKGKYLDPDLNGGDAARVVYAEKLREDRVRALDVRFARWGWAEARSPLLLARRLAAVGVLPVR